MILSAVSGESDNANVGSPPGNIFFNKGEGFGFLFVSAFMLHISSVLCPVILNLAKRPVPGILSPVFAVLSYFLFAVFIFMYFNRRSPESNGKSYKSIAGTILSSAAGIILLYLITLVFTFAYKYLLQFLPLMINRDAKALLFVLAVAAAALLLVSMLLIGVALFTAIFVYRMDINKIGKTLLIILSGVFRNFLKWVYYSLIAAILIYVVSIILNFLPGLVKNLMPQSFYSNFVLYILSAVTNGYLFLVLLNMSRNLLKGTEGRLADLAARPIRLPVPVFAIIIVLLSVIMTGIQAPLNSNSTDSIIAEVGLHMEKGKALSRLGLVQKSIYEYNIAYSKLLSLKGYLEGLKYIKTQDNNDLNASVKDMEEAAGLITKNPYISYFNGELQLLNKNYNGAIEHFKTAIRYPGGVAESWLGMLDAYKLSEMPDKVAEVTGILTTAEIFYDRYSGLKRFNPDKIDRYIEKLNEIEKQLGPNMVYKAVEKTKYLDANGALQDLLALQQKYPEDPAISYFIAKTADFFRNEQSNYDTVRKSAEAFDAQMDSSANTDEDINKNLVVARMYIGANDFAAAERVLSQAYGKYSSDAAVAEQYAYVLYKSNKPDDALKVLDELLQKEPGNYRALYLSAVCLISRQDVKSSLEKISGFIEITEKDPQFLQALDEYLYSYSLAFSKIFSNESAVSELEKYKENTLLYNYLYAINGWKQRDSAMSNEFISKVVEANDKLGYAWYIMGINHYEDTVRNNNTDFSKAAEYYLKSLEILPDHAEGYFALAYCYKKWGKNAEALRAFRKVVDLMPYEDHRTDPYGITVHAIGEVSALSEYDVKGGN